jgi:hypothetical protein
MAAVVSQKQQLRLPSTRPPNQEAGRQDLGLVQNDGVDRAEKARQVAKDAVLDGSFGHVYNHKARRVTGNSRLLGDQPLGQRVI